MKKFKPTYSRIQMLMASPVNPMPTAQQQYQSLHIYQGLEALTKQDQPDKEDWNVLSDAINLAETLVTMGYMQDSGTLEQAVRSMALAGQRYLRGQAIRLDGLGLQAVRDVVETYTEALSVLPHRVMLDCHRQTERRVWGILHGQSQAHDVCVTAI